MRRSQLSSDTFENDTVNIERSRGKEDYTAANKFRHVETIYSSFGHDLDFYQFDPDVLHRQTMDESPKEQALDVLP